METLYRLEVQSPKTGEWLGIWDARRYQNAHHWEGFTGEIPRVDMMVAYHSLPPKKNRPNLRSRFWYKKEAYLDCNPEWAVQMGKENGVKVRVLMRKNAPQGKIFEDDTQAAFWHCTKTNRIRKGPKINI